MVGGVYILVVSALIGTGEVKLVEAWLLLLEVGDIGTDSRETSEIYSSRGVDYTSVTDLHLLELDQEHLVLVTQGLDLIACTHLLLPFASQHGLDLGVAGALELEVRISCLELAAQRGALVLQQPLLVLEGGHLPLHVLRGALEAKRDTALRVVLANHLLVVGLCLAKLAVQLLAPPVGCLQVALYGGELVGELLRLPLAHLHLLREVVLLACVLG